MNRRLAIAAVAVLALAGCATDPPNRKVEVHQPLSIRPVVQAVATPPANGAIYQASAAPARSSLSLFEDRRARTLGDVLTIEIKENVSASKTASSTADRKSSMKFSVPDATIGGRGVRGGSITTEGDTGFEGKGDSAANNVFTGTIAVTVIEVLPNGNLVVAGEKQIGINQGSEFIRLSGVVNPAYILNGNVVSSVNVADARLEYRGTGYINEAQTIGWLQRAFNTAMPF
jgi:flagellar L-ring protein FlgH